MGGQVLADVPVFKFTERGHESTTVQRQVNPLTIPGVAWTLSAELKHESEDEASSAARFLYSSYGADCYVNSGMYPDLFRQDPALWIQKCLLERVRMRYLLSLKSLAHAEADLAALWAGKVLDLVEADEIVSTTLLPVAGLHVDAPITSGSLTMRPITMDEFADLAGDEPAFSLGGGPLRSTQFPRFVRERAVLEAREARPKRAQDMGGCPLIHRAVLAFQLMGFDPTGESRAVTFTEPFPLSGIHSNLVLLAAHGESRTVGQEELDGAVHLARRFPDEVFAAPQSRRAIALARFRTAVTERGKSDAVLDYAIALEAVLLPETKDTELRYRFSLFGAWFLGRDREDRARLFKRFESIYDARSSIVHGSWFRKPEELEQVATSARELTAAVLRRALIHDWPIPNSLRQATFG